MTPIVPSSPTVTDMAVMWLYLMRGNPDANTQLDFCRWCAQGERHCQEMFMILMLDMMLNRLSGMSLETSQRGSIAREACSTL